jgi:hypothetical protein
MSYPITDGCSEIVANDIAMDGESLSNDPDIRRRDWGPSLRILSSFDARVVLVSMQRGISTRNNQTILPASSSDLGFRVFHASMVSFLSKDTYRRCNVGGHGVDGVVVSIVDGRRRSLSDQNTFTVDCMFARTIL